MFDSPFLICQRCNLPVLLDQTRRECAQEHHCPLDETCPLARYFCGHDFSEPSHAPCPPLQENP